MTPRDRFKVGFLQRCAERGLDVDQAEDIARNYLKQAAPGVAPIPVNPSNVVDGVKTMLGIARDGVLLPAAASVLVGSGIGVLGGSALAGAGDRGGDLKTQVEDLRKRELINAYNVYADRAEERTKLDAEASQQTSRGLRL